MAESCICVCVLWHVIDTAFLQYAFLLVLDFLITEVLCFQIDLPDFDKLRREANFAPDEMRAEMKRLGILPPRTYQERDIIIASTSMELSITFF